MSYAENMRRIEEAVAGDDMPVIVASSDNVHSRIYSLDDVDAELIENWQVLEHCTNTPNPFYEHWLLPQSVRLFAENSDVRLFTCWNGTELIGLMPLGTQAKYSRWPIPHWANWLHPNAFLGAPLIVSGKECAFWAALLRHLDESPRLNGFLHLQTIPLDSPVFGALAHVCAEQGRQCDIVQSEHRAMLATSLAAEAYYTQTVRKKKRKELGRLKNRLAELGALEFTQSPFTSALEVEQWTAAFLKLERSGWKGSNGSALDCADNTRAYFKHIITKAWRRGKFHRADLNLDGRPIAMLATLMSGDQGFSFKTAFDEGLAHYSPGVLLQIENLGLPELEGLTRIDSCAAAGHPMIDSLWAERRPIGRVSVSLSGLRRTTQFALLRTGERLLEKRRMMKVQLSADQD